MDNAFTPIERQRIICAKPADRDQLVTILARNDYTVRQAREKKTSSSSYTYFVEFWREGKAK